LKYGTYILNIFSSRIADPFSYNFSIAYFKFDFRNMGNDYECCSKICANVVISINLITFSINVKIKLIIWDYF